MKTVPGHEDSEHIRGMMPSFDVLHDAQATLAAEHEAARRWHENEQRLRAPKPVAKQRLWPWMVAIVAVLAVGAVALSGSQAGSGAPAPDTPVDRLPWGIAETASGLRVDLPAPSVAGSISTFAGTGRQLRTQVLGFDITVAEVALPVGSANARALVAPMIRERANLLSGHNDAVTAVGSRFGQAFEGMIATSAPVARVRVVVDALALYLVEIRGDMQSPRAEQIFDRVVRSLTPAQAR